MGNGFQFRRWQARIQRQHNYATHELAKIWDRSLTRRSRAFAPRKARDQKSMSPSTLIKEIRTGHPQYYFGNLTNPAWGNVSDFDIVGVSYYPTTQDFHSFSLLQSNLNAMADSYPGKKLMVLETALSLGNLQRGNSQWPSTPAGQQQFLSDLQSIVLNLHNNAGAGLVYWYPESVQVPGYTIYNGGVRRFFDATRSALPAISTFGITLVPGDYDRDGLVTAADYVLWRKNDGSPAAYDIWRAHFDQTAGSGSGATANAAVPEPTTLVLLMFAAIDWYLRRAGAHR